jgi:predicted dehydrogenase
VCTIRKESAEESAKRFEARLAFHDYREMLAHSDIDAVAVVLRVPSHYQTTLDAINAGKHVFIEWPLGKTLAEARTWLSKRGARRCSPWWDCRRGRTPPSYI